MYLTDAMGPQQLLVDAIYADGTKVSLNRSKRITFASQDPKVARVSKDGEVVAVHAGSTKIIINRKYSVDVIVRPSRQ
jgi:hypothetical protein